MALKWLFPHCVGITVLVVSAISGAVVLGDAASDRATALEDLEKAHKERTADLQKALDKEIAIFDAQVAKKEKLERRQRMASTASQARIIAREFAKAEELREAAYRRGKVHRDTIDELTVQYEQDRRRVKLETPLPGDPEYVQEDGLIYTRKEFAETERLRRDHGSPEVVADAYIQSLINDGVLETASRTGSRPFQLTNGPPQHDKMMVFYQCRYTSKGGFVNDREGHIVVGQDKRGFWFVSDLTRLTGIEF